jgi:hypothetical protein
LEGFITAGARAFCVILTCPDDKEKAASAAFFISAQRKS